MDLNESTDLCSLANESSARHPEDDECVFRVAAMHRHWDIIKDLSLVPLRWLILLLVDSRLMHFNKPSLRSGSVPPHCSPRPQPRPNNLSPSWRSIKQFEGHVEAEANKSLFSSLARHKKADWCVCLLAESSFEFSQRWRFLWPPAVLCDPGARGDKTAITLLYPPCSLFSWCRICASPRGAAAGRSAACHPDPAASGRLAGRHTDWR